MALVVVFLLWVYISVVIEINGVEFGAAYAGVRRRYGRQDGWAGLVVPVS